YALPQGREEPRADRVQCANLIYAGSKTSQCFSDRFLKRLEQETTIRAETHFRTVRLDSPELCRYPFGIMTGEGGSPPTPARRLSLRGGGAPRARAVGRRLPGRFAAPLPRPEADAPATESPAVSHRLQHRQRGDAQASQRAERRGPGSLQPPRPHRPPLLL